MRNLLPPTFSRICADTPATVECFTPLQIYGRTVGHFVALIRATEEQTGTTLQLIVGQEGGEAAETIAILPDTAAGEADAEATADAILRTLAIVRRAFVGDTGSPAPDH